MAMKLKAGDFWLSKHFSFFECTKSRDHPELVKANREYFSHQPYLDRLIFGSEYMLEGIREIVDAPVIVNNGGRFPELNAAVGGVSTSQHLFARMNDGAYDITVPGQKVEMVAFKIFNHGLSFYQMRVYTKIGFIHIGMPRRYRDMQISFPESEAPGWAK